MASILFIFKQVFNVKWAKKDFFLFLDCKISGVTTIAPGLNCLSGINNNTNAFNIKIGKEANFMIVALLRKFDEN